MLQWPYDPAAPNGVPPGTGITVNAVFTDPDGREFVQPAFYAQQFLDEIRDGRDWHLPTGTFSWKVRFSPNRAGTWTYRIVATDANGTVESPRHSLSVTSTSRRGFIRVSQADPRYFEFDDGSPFFARGFEYGDHLDDPTTKGGPAYARLAGSGVNLVRLWISSVFGSAWNIWIGGRNQYRGYLPNAGLLPFYDSTTGRTSLTVRLDYEPGGDTGWFDACRLQWWDDLESIKPNTTYRIRIQYHAEGITGPRIAGSSHGLVAKFGGWYPDCYEPGTGTPVTGYGGNNTGFGYIEGTWNSGNQNFLPRMHLGLENVRQGVAYVRHISLREDLGGGNLGPETMVKPSMDMEQYIPEEKAFALDKLVRLAEQNGVYLKLVLMDKTDEVYFKMDDDGSWVTGGEPDNEDGFYGLGRTMNRTRWLQQVWWRYLQARWGYSPNIHSWELTNEGDPALTRHYEMTDELGKFMQCRVFGVEVGAGDGGRCALGHPNRHLVTTSMWSDFPGTEFWGNAKYPNVDYADLHAYISTSYAPLSEKQAMQWDAARYHLWHSASVGGWRIGKPVVRGEAGLDSPTEQSETVLGLSRDTNGVWLHNYLWSGLDSGGLHELYWWSSHILNGAFDTAAPYRSLQNFLDDIPLNKGGFVDWGGTVSGGSLRVAGQKNTAAGALHLWVQNTQHTWKNVVDGVAVTPASGQIVIPGFRAGTAYTLERWDTYGGRIASSESVTADAGGSLRIAVTSLSTDVALKIPSAGRAPGPPANVRIIR